MNKNCVVRLRYGWLVMLVQRSVVATLLIQQGWCCETSASGSEMLLRVYHGSIFKTSFLKPHLSMYVQCRTAAYFGQESSWLLYLSHKHGKNLIRIFWLYQRSPVK